MPQMALPLSKDTKPQVQIEVSNYTSFRSDKYGSSS